VSILRRSQTESEKMADFPTTNANLLVRLQDPKDRAAWDDFVAIYQPVLMQLLARRGLQNSDAEEIVQETFVAIANSIDRWQPDESLGNFRSWLSRVSRNLAINYLTRQPIGVKGTGASDHFEMMNEVPSASTEATDEFDLQQKRQVFLLAAERVRVDVQENTWRAFWMSCIDNIPAEKIAAELGMTTGAVYVAKSRVVARLKSTIDNFGFLPQ
jgi:RNA polymerase sigma factor (sigma-70 family)